MSHLIGFNIEGPWAVNIGKIFTSPINQSISSVNKKISMTSSIFLMTSPKLLKYTRPKEQKKTEITKSIVHETYKTYKINKIIVLRY